MSTPNQILPSTPAEASSQPPSPSKSTRLPLAILLLAAAAFLVFLRARIHFDWPLFLAQLRLASPLHIATGIALILSTNFLRSARWSLFLPPSKRVPPFSLVATQFIGFSAVALFGRIADLTRPYLVSRRVGLPLASQIAVYTIERIFDLAGLAILFSTMLFITPRATPHHEVFVRTGLLSFAGTIFLVLFVVAVRLSGERLATLAESLLSRLSKPFATRVAEKLLHFRDGLNALGSPRDLLLAAALSVAMWAMIAEAYVQTTHAFVHTPTLAALTFATTMPLMAASMGGSLLQLPVLGWFTQIAITATAMHALYAAPIEDATACGAVLLIVNTLCLIPIGLIWARIEHTTLRAAAHSTA